jgi:hypothetical protein
MRQLALAWSVAILLAASGCAGGTSVTLALDGSLDAGGEARVLPEVVADAGTEEVMPDGAGPETAGDTAVPPVDGSGDSIPGCKPGDGCFLDPCAENADCLSGLCVEHMGDGVCTLPCQEECPAGWTCKQVGTGGPDVVWACVSRHANLCKPCGSADGCKSPGGVDDACVAYGAEGSFCGGTCVDDQDCPWGFACVKATTVDGVELAQCVASTGTCACTAKSVALGLSTPCELSNDQGTCGGKRVCTQAGLSACDAPVPAAETCNGLDDNCNGQADEPVEKDGTVVAVCDDGNDCTTDVCNGEAGCEHVSLDGVECKDGDTCTTADKCVAGVCVGDPVVCEDSNPCTDDTCSLIGGCEHLPNKADCDDGDPCTVGDICGNAECKGTTVPCDCNQDSDCKALEDGDLCNGTLVCDKAEVPFQCAVDPATTVTCPEPAGADAPCLKTVCDPVGGACGFEPYHDGYACSDGDACTVGDSCAEGTCVGGPSANCNDGNPCTDDGCDPTGGCQHEPNSVPCQDGSACTVGDTCAASQCQPGDVLDCDDGNPCTDDWCDPAGGCQHKANAAACDDGNPCTLGDHCAGSVCVASDTNLCNDGNLCTTDWCSPDAGCMHDPNQVPCDDGDACTKGDACGGGKCLPGDIVLCDDGNVCTTDWCNPAAGCQVKPNSLPCDDNNTCTTDDVCSLGVCKGIGTKDCDDANPCTKDICVAGGGCQHENLSGPCSDGDPCTVGDACAGGTCVPGAPDPCNDGNGCTDDACVKGQGCTHKSNTQDCDDGNACTVDDVCAGGACKPGKPLSCDDSDVCTSDSCVPDAGCLYTFSTAWCDDGDACTVADTCDTGQCKGTASLTCDDGNLCTNDTCDKVKGCQFVPNAAGCDDGNACTVGDICSGGQCKAGTPLACDPGMICINGGCVSSCPIGFELCKGVCVNKSTDPANCGDCGFKCGNSQVCADGKCVMSCPVGQADCNGVCTSLSWDPAHCGTCETQCKAAPNAAIAYCANKACGVVCDPGFGDCNFGPVDGCETNLKTSVTDCNACDNECQPKAHAAQPSCSNGACGFICDANWDNCNLDGNDGCEADLLTSKDHCGGCFQPCGVGKKCSGGSCVSEVVPATCADLLTTMNVWGRPSKGVVLMKWTNSTLHYMGCPGDGCAPAEFFCTYNAVAQTLEFGSTGQEVRAVVDPNNANGDTIPGSYSGCCKGPLGLCNALDPNNNGVPVDGGKALCAALGYADGAITGWTNSNTCPEVHAVTADGKSWSSDWVNSLGYGWKWKCTGFK